MTKRAFRIYSCLLFIAAGLLELYAYRCCGHVFANIQAGNLLFFGLFLARRDLADALHFLLPVFAYCFGVAGFLFCKHLLPEKPWRLRLAVCIVKAALLLLALSASQTLAALALSTLCGFGAQEYADLRNFINQYY